MGVGCKFSGSESSETQGSGLSVGRMEFRDPRALQAQQTGNTGLSSGLAVKNQVQSKAQNYETFSTQASSAQGSTSASEYAQSLNQYAKAMSSARAQGGVFNQGQPAALTLDSLILMDKSEALARWNGTHRSAVQLEVNKLKAEMHNPSNGLVREAINLQAEEQLTAFVKAYNQSHPNQLPVVY